MRWLPQSLGARLAIALAIAAGAVVALDHLVVAADATASRRLPLPAPASPAAPPLVRLDPVPGEIVLAGRIDLVPPEAAPVVQIFADGSMAVRPPRLQQGAPAAAPAAASAIVLPGAGLERLDARARATLVAVIAMLAPERPVRAARFRAAGFRFDPEQIARLLSWTP